MQPEVASIAAAPDLEARVADLEDRLIQKPNDYQTIKRLILFLSRSPRNSRIEGKYNQFQKNIAEYTEPFDHAIRNRNFSNFLASFNKFIYELDHSKLNLNTSITQLHRGQLHYINNTWANCELRLKLFDERSVISSICQDCFKVQILTKSIYDLIKLHFLLWNCTFPRDNARKTMVELRPYVKYPYKGYIYCNSETEAENCRDIVLGNISQYELSESVVNLSHGCSEHSLSYPSFRYSPDGEHRLMEIPNNWKKAEDEFLEENPESKPVVSDHNVDFISLMDALTFRTYIDYAELIGDETAYEFRSTPSTSKPEPFASQVWAQTAQRRKELAELRSM